MEHRRLSARRVDRLRHRPSPVEDRLVPASDAEPRRRGPELINRYGGVGLAIAALTPLPYSLASWAAGTSELRYWQFLLISAPFRAIRVTSVLWLFSLGLWALES